MRRSVLALFAVLVAIAVVFGVPSRPPTPPTVTVGTPPTDSRDANPTAGASTSTGSVGAPTVRPETAPSEPSPLPPSMIAEPVTISVYGANRNFENELALYFGAPSDVLFLGDSITDFLARGPGKPLWDEIFQQIGGLNFGVAAARTSHVLWQVETGQVAMAAPKVVVLMIGTNNLAAGEPSHEVAAGVEKIVKAIGEQLPNTRILLLSILPRGAEAINPLRTAVVQTNQLLANLANDRVTYLDISSWFVSFDGSISTTLMSDGTHPSTMGYLVYTILIWETLMGLYLAE